MANSKIKGITVEIGGNATKLGKALQDSETKSKSLQAELRQVESALKFNPNNVELLTQKQELLTQQVEETRKALDVLKSAESQVASQFKSGEIGEEQYRAFQREIIQTESKLKSYENKLDQTESSLKSLNTASGKAEKSTEELKKELREAEDALKDVKESASDVAGELGKIGGVGIAGATVAVKSAVSMEQALNSLQAQTGKTDLEMLDFKETLERLYEGDYGESMDHLADSMAKVAQHTGETDPKVLEDMTRNLLTLEDTFEMDFNETLRGVNGLMKNMGLTSEEAFDYITKGAQNGLNKTDELGDNLAEYTQLWGQAGFSAEEMFAILDNGLKNGAYNLDKVNDFVKEFTISLADGRIEDNIESFGTETQNLFKQWKKGKATSADVFKSVVKDLKNTKNQQDALTTASNVWSDLGEDNAMKIITSLGDVNETFDNVKGTMEEVNDVKYDDVGNRLESLGRKFMTDVANPIGEKLIPIAEKFISYASNNLDDLIGIVKALGIAFGTIFVVNKVSTFVSSIKNLYDKFSSLGTLLSAHPLGAVATVVGLASGAMIALKTQADKAREKIWGLTEENKKLNEAINAEAEAIREANEARKEANKSIESETAHNQNLWKELQTIVDKNGKIKKGYEDRAKVITTQLKEALGIEIEIVDGQIVRYDELKKSIEEVIRTKRAEALLEVNKKEYTTAIDKQTDAFGKYNDAIKNVADTEEKLANAKENLQKVIDARDSYYDADNIAGYQAALIDAEKAVETATDAHNKNKKALADAQSNYLGYCNTIENYQGLMGAVASGDAKKLEDAMNKLSNSFITAENATKKMLENQLKDFKKQYENMKLAVKEGMPGVSQEQVDQMADLVTKAEAELKKLEGKATDVGKKSAKNVGNGAKAQSKDVKNAGVITGNNFIDGVSSKLNNAKTTGENVSKATNTGLSSANTKATGTGMANKYIIGLSSKLGSAKSTGKSVSSATNTGLNSANTKSTGSTLAGKFVSGVSSKSGSAKSSGKTVATSAKSGLGSVKTNSTGSNFIQGFINGVNGKNGSLLSVCRSLASSALSAIKKRLGINSPSKEARYLGEGFDEGFIDGIAKGEGDAVKEAENLADKTLKALNKVNEVEFRTRLNGADVGDFDKSLQLKVNNADYKSSTNALGAIFGDKLDKMAKQITNLKIVLDNGVLVGETVGDYDTALGERKITKDRGW